MMNGNIQKMIPPPQQQWRKKFPSVVTGIFSFVQFVITIVIIGCEVGGILIDMVTATIYVGFWASLFFTVAWISQASSSCCCHSRGCASYTLVIQCISLFFAACVIGFDSYYLVYPTTCFFSSGICTSTGYTRGLFYSSTNFNNIKLPLIKGQLAAGAVMFVLCLIYIIIYIIISIQVNQSPSVYPQNQNLHPTVPTVSNGVLTAPPVNYTQSPRVVDHGEGRITELLCPTCNTKMNMTMQKRPQV